MNREIKFRIWDEKQHRMFIFNLFSIHAGGSVVYCIPECKDSNCDHVTDIRNDPGKPIPSPIMQYTGLKDKNGIELYEGDIVKELSVSYEVKFGSFYDGETNEPEAGIGFYLQDKEFITALLPDMELELLGNIYETPALLTS